MAAADAFRNPRPATGARSVVSSVGPGSGIRDWGFVKAWPSRFPESSQGFAARAWATAYSRNPTRTFPNPQSRTPNPGRNGHCPHPHHGHGPRTRPGRADHAAVPVRARARGRGGAGGAGGARPDRAGRAGGHLQRLLVERCDECDRDDDPGHGAGPHRRAQSPGRLAAAAFERRRAAAAAAVFGGRRPQFLVHAEHLGDRALPADRLAPVGADRREPVAAADAGVGCDHHGRWPDHGRQLAADPAQRPAGRGQRQPAFGRGHAGTAADVRADADRPGAAGGGAGRLPLLRPPAADRRHREGRDPGAQPQLFRHSLRKHERLVAANANLPSGVGTLDPLQMFAPMPIGPALLVAALAYFHFFGNRQLRDDTDKGVTPARTQSYFAKSYGSEGEVFELTVSADSPLVGMSLGEAEALHGAPLLLALKPGNESRLAPPRAARLWVGRVLSPMGTRQKVSDVAPNHCLPMSPPHRTFRAPFNPTPPAPPESDY